MGTKTTFLCILLVAVSVLFTASSSASTIAYWRFEEGVADEQASGADSILDSSGEGNTGDPTTTGADLVYRTNVPVAVIPLTGVANTLCMEFDDTGYIEIDNTIDMSGSVTVEAWVYYEGPTISQHMVLSNVGDWRFGYQDASVDAFGFYGDSGSVYTAGWTSTKVAMNAWHHVAYVYDQSLGEKQVKIYVDGILSREESCTGDIPSGGVTRIGTYSTIYEWDGYIDEIRISDVALDPEEFLNAPEPATLVLFGTGLGGLFLKRRKRKRK